MDIEMKLALYYILLYVLAGILVIVLNKIGIKYTKKTVLVLDLFLLAGGIFVSFILFKNEEFYLKYIFPIFCLIFLIWDTYLYIKPKSKFDEITAEENKWREEQKNKNK